ncbi:hypothetical protein ABPG77_008070 [Micractinium sp. CCAP 211/92]
MALETASRMYQPEIDLSRDDFAERYTTKEALAIDWEELTLLAEHTIGVKQVKAYAENMRNSKTDRAILVTEAMLTSFARQCLSQMAPKYKVELFLHSEVVVNITHHSIVPRHELLSRAEAAELLRRYKIKDTQLPRIQHSDPVARYFGLARGQIVRIVRDSETAGRYVTYRLCV